MTSRHSEMTKALHSRHIHGKHRPTWIRALGKRLHWVSTREMYAQFGMVAVLTAVTVLLAFPAPIKYQVGDVAEYTIRAERGLRILDPVTTERSQAEAEASVAPVFVLDDAIIPMLEDEAAAIFRRGRELALMLDNPPDREAAPQRRQELEMLEEAFFTVFKLPRDTFIWQKTIASRFHPSIERQVLSLTSEVMAQGLLDQPNELFGQRQRPASIILMSSRTEYAVPSVASLMDEEEAQRFLEIRARALSARFSPEEVNLIVTLAKGLMQPNLKPDLVETNRRMTQARESVPAAYMNIRAGEVIVREGSVIGVDAMEKIKALRETASSYNWVYKFAGLFVVLFVFFNSSLILSLISVKTGAGTYKPIPLREQLFMTLLLILVALMAHSASLFGSSLSWDFDFVDSRTILYAMPISAATMLTAIFFGVRKAAFMALYAAMVATIVSPTGKFMVFVYSYNGAIAATWCLRNMNERGHLIPASFWVMVVNCLTLLGLTLYGDMQWTRQTAYNFCAAAASGVLSGIMASGMIPIIESAFGFSTNLKLLELGNLDRPLLRELMLTAPGTYHHSVIVGAMVEAAAEAIGANPHLARVGAYYHDIGKMKKPLYFVENQTGENRHDTLSPSMSALILIGHVKDGAELAREYHLPQDIVDIVEQHHGTSLMAFFYHKAKEQRQEGQPEINEGDYRYPGPRPRRKEAGLVMLADICEAATRSLSEPTPTKIRNMVRLLVNQVFSDGQLDDCELTGREISEVINNFTTILIGIYHHRVAYPGGRKDAAKDKEAPEEKREIRPEARTEPKEIYGHLPVEPPKGVTH